LSAYLVENVRQIVGFGKLVICPGNEQMVLLCVIVFHRSLPFWAPFLIGVLHISMVQEAAGYLGFSGGN